MTLLILVLTLVGLPEYDIDINDTMKYWTLAIRLDTLKKSKSSVGRTAAIVYFPAFSLYRTAFDWIPLMPILMDLEIKLCRNRSGALICNAISHVERIQ